MNLFVDENIEERYAEGLYEDFIFEEYEKIIFDYLANNCKEFDDEHIQHLVDLKVKQFFKLRQQITQLTNNWNELEEWVKEKRDYYDRNDEYSNFRAYADELDDVLCIMKEMKKKNDSLQ